MTIADQLRVVVCGSGAASHVLACHLSTRTGVATTVFTMNSHTAAGWEETMIHHELVVETNTGGTALIACRGNPATVTCDPALAGRGCDLAIVAVPAFLHERYLGALGPYLPDGCLIVGLPGQPGFEFAVRAAAGMVGGSPHRWPMVVFDSLPWVCRRQELGRRVRVSATKQCLVGAAEGDLASSRVADPLTVLQELLGSPPALRISGHVLGITLRSPNASNHPPMMYSHWRHWPGTPVPEAPLFYEGIDEEGAGFLEQVSGEVVGIARHIMARRPDVDLSVVVPQLEWERQYYGAAITDASSLLTALRTNPGYAGIAHPMARDPGGGWVPDFTHRFLSEDVPFGIVVLRGIAEVVGYPTPCMDAVIAWSQERLGACYLVGGSLSGPGVLHTRCPQRYGLNSLEALLGETAQPSSLCVMDLRAEIKRQ